MANNNLSTIAKSAEIISANHLSLRINSKLVPIFFQLLGHGFSYRINGGCSIKNLLCSQLGIHEDYLADRIKTIFLNSKVVDSVDRTIVDAGDRLALSGPMPGLVGAILRSGGYYAAMRSQISHEENKAAANNRSANITIKLLNLVAKELGPIFLQRGIQVSAQTLQEFLDRWAEDLSTGFISGELDGKPLAIHDLKKIAFKKDAALLNIQTDEAT